MSYYFLGPLARRGLKNPVTDRRNDQEEQHVAASELRVLTVTVDCVLTWIL